MKKLFKYIGISAFLLFSFYYTDKLSNMTISNSQLVREINDNKDNFEILPVSAEINDNYIIPGLNGYVVNVLKSYDNMRFLDTFNSYYLEYDIIKPSISIENNKEKIIKYGNPKKNAIAIIIKDNKEIIDYANEKNIRITRLITKETFYKDALYEQINNDDKKYREVEKLLINNNNICYLSSNIEDICKEYKKYLVEESIILNKYNLSFIKDKIKSGYIIYINDDVNLVDFKLLLKQIYYQDLNVVYLSNLIREAREERD